MTLHLIIDSDLGIDDCLAICLAARCPAVRIEAIAAVGGNVPLIQAWRNLQQLAHLLWPAGDGPILLRGLDQTEPGLLNGTHKHGPNGLGGVELPEAPRYQPPDLHATCADLIRTHGPSLHILAIGPLTNLASIHAEKPRLLQRAGGITIMGGAVFKPANMLDGNAEFNFYRDPAAARTILALPMPRTLVPLDLTLAELLAPDVCLQLQQMQDPVASILAPMLRHRLADPSLDGRGAAIHDAIALARLIHPAWFIDCDLTADVADQAQLRGKLIWEPARHDEPWPLRTAVKACQPGRVSEWVHSLLLPAVPAS